MLKTPELLTSGHTAFLMINCEAGHETHVIENIKAIEGVKEAIRTSGPHDIFCTIEASSIESLGHIIEEKIRKTENVRSTTTLVKSL